MQGLESNTGLQFQIKTVPCLHCSRLSESQTRIMREQEDRGAGSMAWLAHGNLWLSLQRHPAWRPKCTGGPTEALEGTPRALQAFCRHSGSGATQHLRSTLGVSRVRATSAWGRMNPQPRDRGSARPPHPLGSLQAGSSKSAPLSLVL